MCFGVCSVLWHFALEFSPFSKKFGSHVAPQLSISNHPLQNSQREVGAGGLDGVKVELLWFPLHVLLHNMFTACHKQSGILCCFCLSFYRWKFLFQHWMFPLFLFSLIFNVSMSRITKVCNIETAVCAKCSVECQEKEDILMLKRVAWIRISVSMSLVSWCCFDAQGAVVLTAAWPWNAAERVDYSWS